MRPTFVYANNARGSAPASPRHAMANSRIPLLPCRKRLGSKYGAPSGLSPTGGERAFSAIGSVSLLPPHPRVDSTSVQRLLLLSSSWPLTSTSSKPRSPPACAKSTRRPSAAAAVQSTPTHQWAPVGECAARCHESARRSVAARGADRRARTYMVDGSTFD
jgi:hypothetical protein